MQTFTTMQITTTIAILTVLASATPQNNTSTPINLEPNYNTAAWRSYIGFLAFGVIAAVLWVGVVGFMVVKTQLGARRVNKEKKVKEEKKRDVEMTYVKMKTPEKVASLGRERVFEGRPL
jgi:hypothetical protein